MFVTKVSFLLYLFLIYCVKWKCCFVILFSLLNMLFMVSNQNTLQCDVKRLFSPIEGDTGYARESARERKGEKKTRGTMYGRCARRA